MKVTTQNRHNRTLVKINGKTRCYYDKTSDDSSDSYTFYLGKPSDRIVFGKTALTLSELEEEVNRVIDQYKDLLEFFN